MQIQSTAPLQTNSLPLNVTMLKVPLKYIPRKQPHILDNITHGEKYCVHPDNIQIERKQAKLDHPIPAFGGRGRGWGQLRGFRHREENQLPRQILK